MGQGSVFGEAAPEIFMRQLPLAPDVSAEELSQRLRNIRREMEADELDALVLTDVKNIQYFADFRSFSWYFNSRPFFALITAEAFFLFAAAYEKPYVDAKKRPFVGLYYDGYHDVAAAAVAEAVRAAFKGRTPQIGIDYGEEMNGRGSIAMVDRLRDLARGGIVRSAALTLWRVRRVKTAFEAELKRTAFAICDDAFDQALCRAHIGITEYEWWRTMQAQTFLNGADSGDPFPVIFGNGDFMYGRPPSARRLELGHYVWSDFRATYGGYSADRNRIARAGEPAQWEKDAYKAVRDLTHDVCRSTRPGMTCSEVWADFLKKWAPLSGKNSFAFMNSASVRVGHSSGMDVVELPNLNQADNTEICAGMIFHVEPKLQLDGAVFQCEEVFFVREDGIDFLAPLTPEEIPVIGE